MKLALFKFSLPPELIAKYPPAYREDARLMVVHRDTGKIEHCVFGDIVNFFKEDDIFVLNDSKVFSGRLHGYKEKTGAQIQVLLLRELDTKTHLWDVSIKPARKIRIGNKLYFGNYGLAAEVIDNTTSCGRTIRFDFEGSSATLHQILNEIGTTPLPEILAREAKPADKERYQTVYAKNIGSVVAPDGGLHFTPYILKSLELRDVSTATITIHTSFSVLTPLDIQDLSRFILNSEYFSIPQETTKKVNSALVDKKRVCAVGTCTFKALEASVSSSELLKTTEEWTNKFIYPPYKPKITNALLTNFHLPASIPLINTAAFAGYDLMKKAYDIALKEKYRFFVYGDALLII